MRRLSGTCLEWLDLLVLPALHMARLDQKEHIPMAWRPVHDKDSRLFTINAYLALERTEEERHEYLDGCVSAMVGESPDHGTICMNLSIHLGSQLLGTPCRAFSKDT